ncbi:D-alanyl-D-alanine carboxypeptidase family protein [endosymbiont of unidentified scaly snail isolate Monju]|uniref:D-alanyl-D-alanine carboxypeptidase family protein n=1 Tax=endosymbiont of unidentified scaly snail isolate Monju TaxID=1248727 RepID=UPI0003892A75|nr:D-alanyl-D-alanine carboxypeptidase family protein [endosymbiont of unidentified scaly snail isolate Monju]BAN68128.1 D-alanyl-D-alanine carboxypeptidase [endosymbiont of unidentified scaly snail isolate Monju]
MVIPLILFFLTPFAGAAPVPAPPNIDATGYLLLDMHSGRVLAEKNADQRLEPASLTKIMTAHVVFEELAHGTLKPDDLVTVSEKAWKTEGSRMFIEVNSRVSVADLLKGLIIQSGNDAAVALAEHIAGSEDAFANLMNEHAARLGMQGTHFANATGLPHPDHYTTPRDIARVTIATIRDYPEYYSLYSQKEFTYNKIRQHNRNRLLWRDPTVDGVKTGHTKSAGYCLVASARRDDMRLISVVMGTPSDKARIEASQALLNYGFRFFETHRLYAGGSRLTEARVWMGEQEKVALGLAEDLYLTIPRRQYDKLSARSEIEPDIQAPVHKGQALGEVVVELEGETIARVPLVALREIPEGGLWRQAVDTVQRWLPF